MSAFLKDVAMKVRAHMNDLDAARYVYTTDALYPKINSSMLGTIATRLRLGQTYLSGAVSFDTSSYRWKLPSGVEYTNIRQAHTQGRGRDLEIIAYEKMMTRYNNIIDPSKVTGYPIECAFWELPDQSVEMWLFPWPYNADKVDLMESLLPTSVSQDEDVIPLDAEGIEGLAYDVAAELVQMANAEKLSALRLNPAVAIKYEKNRDICLRASRTRGYGLHAVGHVTQARR